MEKDMGTGRHVVLLRGINVGGHNVIRMADLRACFEAMGFADVETLIQSGNVVLSSTRRTKTGLIRAIERGLGKAFGYEARVVVVSAGELGRIVAQAPAGFGRHRDRYRYDVLFVKAPATPAKVLAHITTRAGVDSVSAGDHALYFRRLIARAVQSHLARFAGHPAYRSVTIRNWSTTMKLHEMASAVPVASARK